MSARAISLAGFIVCAGVTGVWVILEPEHLHTFVLAAGVVCFIAFKQGNAPRGGTGHDPEDTRRIYNLGYTQGIAHGAERARSEGGIRAHARTPRTGASRLPEAG